MEILTINQVVNTVSERWKQQYFSNGAWKYSDKFKDKYEQITALGDSPKAEDIDKIIGNSSWTNLSCTYCNSDVDSVVVLDDGEHSTLICKKCVKKMRKLFKESEEI